MGKSAGLVSIGRVCVTVLFGVERGAKAAMAVVVIGRQTLGRVEMGYRLAVAPVGRGVGFVLWSGRF